MHSVLGAFLNNTFLTINDSTYFTKIDKSNVSNAGKLILKNGLTASCT